MLIKSTSVEPILCVNPVFVGITYTYRRIVETLGVNKTEINAGGSVEARSVGSEPPTHEGRSSKCVGVAELHIYQLDVMSPKNAKNNTI